MDNESEEYLGDFKNNVITPMQIKFIKHLVTVSVVLLPLTSLLPQDQTFDKSLLHGLLVALLVCILSGTATFYTILIRHRIMANTYADLILTRNRGYGGRFYVRSKYDWLVRLLERICVLSFVASCLLIVGFVW